MKSNEIRINSLSQSLTRIAGYKYGVEIFNKDVKEHIDYKAHNIIYVPEYILMVAISFVQGFNEEILKNINKSDYHEVIEFRASEKALKSINQGLNL